MKFSQKKDVSFVVVFLSLIGIFGLSLFAFFHRETINDQLVGLLLLTLCLPLLLASFSFYQKPRSKQNEPQPLFISKRLGFGWTINPNNPIGRWLYVLLALLLVGLFIYGTISG